MSEERRFEYCGPLVSTVSFNPMKLTMSKSHQHAFVVQIHVNEKLSIEGNGEFNYNLTQFQNHAHYPSPEFLSIRKFLEVSRCNVSVSLFIKPLHWHSFDREMP